MAKEDIYMYKIKKMLYDRIPDYYVIEEIICLSRPLKHFTIKLGYKDGRRGGIEMKVRIQNDGKILTWIL